MANILVMSEPVPASYVSGPVNPDLSPTRFGVCAIVHSGGRLASSSTVVVSLQATMNNGASWFDVEVFRPSDVDYVSGTLSSWCRTVPLFDRMRASVASGENRTYTVWISE